MNKKSNSSDKNNPNSRSALLLSGGGARAAYQVGVLKAIAEMLPEGDPFPFSIICGTSAGSINTIALASNMSNFHTAVDKVHDVWSNFKLSHVFYADTKNLFKRIVNWAWTNIGFGRNDDCPSSLLDNAPLRQLLTQHINFDKISASIDSGDLHAYCVTACSYSTGESTTFFDGNRSINDWQRSNRQGRRSKMNLDHLMASSAIPVVFPSVKIGWEYFGDGSMRQTTPISPALHLGADKILIIGLRQEENKTPFEEQRGHPSLGNIAGYVMDTLFLNGLNADLERMNRVNRILESGNSKAGELFRKINYLIINPSSDISRIAQEYYTDLPKSFRIALMFLGMRKANSQRFISYLMFTKRFTQKLIDLGYRDAKARRQELCEYLEIADVCDDK